MSKRSRRQLLIVFAVAMLVGVMASWLLCAWPRSGITRRNVAKIQKGMARADVESILGGPERLEVTGPTKLDLTDADPVEARRRRECAFFIGMHGMGEGANIWISDEVGVLVDFDGEEIESVTEIHSVPRLPSRETAVEMLRRWLRL